jgi:hypothetical protein
MAMPKGWPLDFRWLPSPKGDRLHATSDLEAFCGVPVRVPLRAVLDSNGRRCRRCAHLINTRAKAFARKRAAEARGTGAKGEPR